MVARGFQCAYRGRSYGTATKAVSEISDRSIYLSQSPADDIPSVQSSSSLTSTPLTPSASRDSPITSLNTLNHIRSDRYSTDNQDCESSFANETAGSEAPVPATNHHLALPSTRTFHSSCSKWDTEDEQDYEDAFPEEALGSEDPVSTNNNHLALPSAILPSPSSSLTVPTSSTAIGSSSFLPAILSSHPNNSVLKQTYPGDYNAVLPSNMFTLQRRSENHGMATHLSSSGDADHDHNESSLVLPGTSAEGIGRRSLSGVEKGGSISGTIGLLTGDADTNGGGSTKAAGSGSKTEPEKEAIVKSKKRKTPARQGTC